MTYNFESVYEQCFSDALNTIKQDRDNWDCSVCSTLVHHKTKYSELWDSDGYTLRNVIKKSDEVTRSMLFKLFTQMMIHRDPTSEVVRISAKAYIEYSGTETKASYKVPLSVQPEYQAVITTVQGHKMLFIFKEYGLANHLPDQMLKQIIEAHAVNGYMYISLVDAYAYDEKLNHNDNRSDPIRGTNIYSIPVFIKLLFGSDEFALFERYYLEYR